jgi:hypothetical protein
MFGITHKICLFLLFISLLTESEAQNQVLRKHMICFGVSGGFLQQEANLSYQYAPFFLKGGDSKKVGNQIFFGIEAGTTQLRSSVSGPTSSFANEFQMRASGQHYSFLITNIISHPLVNRNKPFQYRYIGLKFTTERFNNVDARIYDLNNENDDLDSDEPDVIITNQKCNSFEFTIRYGRLRTLNSNNHFRFEIYSGIRFCTVTGTSNSDYYNGVYWVHDRSTFTRSINPLIFGVGLSYQINVGRNKYRKT